MIRREQEEPHMLWRGIKKTWRSTPELAEKIKSIKTRPFEETEYITTRPSPHSWEGMTAHLNHTTE